MCLIRKCYSLPYQHDGAIIMLIILFFSDNIVLIVLLDANDQQSKIASRC